MKSSFKIPSFFSLNKINEEEIENYSKNNINSKKYWSPTGNLDYPHISRNASRVSLILEKLKKNPKKIRNDFIKFDLISLILFSLMLLYLFNQSTSFDFLDLMWTAISAFFLTILPSVFVRKYYNELQRDLIKIQVADSNSWLYDPNEDENEWSKLRNLFIEVFEKGNRDRYVHDRFFGDRIINSKSYYFTSGRFHYARESGSGKSKSTKTYDKHYFIFALNKRINSRFYLYPEAPLSIGFNRKEINTESIEFNKMFAFSYNGSKDEKGLEIVKTLSPAVQQKLIDLKKNNSVEGILFAQNTITFMFNGNLLEKMKTNLKKDLNVASEDLRKIDLKLQNMVEIFEGISKYID